MKHKHSQFMWFVVLFFSLFPLISYADFTYQEPQGFHWYTHTQDAQIQQKTPRPQKARVNRSVSTKSKMSPYQQLQYLSMQTRNTLSTALIHPSVANTTKYMYAQQYWAKKIKLLSILGNRPFYNTPT